MSEKTTNRLFVIVIGAVASTGGLLFGFDTGVISGALPFLIKSWGLNSEQVELITTAALIGAVFGALFSGRITDVFGRKKVIIVAGIFFATGSILTGASSDMVLFFISRLIIGVAIGISSFAVPLYISEISPAKIRGALVFSFQLMIATGVLASYFSDLLFADESNPFSWRWMFYVGVFPAIILLLGMIFLPETPRFLIQNGRENEGITILKKIEEPGLIKDSIAKIKQDISISGKSNWKELLMPHNKMPLFIAIGIMCVQQLVGINSIIYYAPTVFLSAGFDGPRAAITATISVGIINVLATVITMFLIDKIGRRKLYFIGLTGMAISLAALGATFLFKDNLGVYAKYAAVASSLLYVGFFAGSLGPLGWLIISEVFPLKVRGLGMSIGAFSNWFFNAIVTFTFLKLAWALTSPGMEIASAGESGLSPNPAGSFFIYSIVAIAGIIWGYKYIPETKGKSLEEIENHWKSGKMPKELVKDVNK